MYDYLYGNVKILKEKEVAHMLADRLVLEVDEAEERGKIEVAKRLLKRGLKIEDISEDTELPIDKIRILQTQYA